MRTQLSYSRNFYYISTYVTCHVTFGLSIHPQITHSPPSPPLMNDSQSTRRQRIRKTTSPLPITTGAPKAHFGHPYTFTAMDNSRASAYYQSRRAHQKYTLGTPKHVQPWTILGLRQLSNHYSICLGRMEDVAS